MKYNNYTVEKHVTTILSKFLCVLSQLISYLHREMTSVTTAMLKGIISNREFNFSKDNGLVKWKGKITNMKCENLSKSNSIILHDNRCYRNELQDYVGKE